MDTHDDDEQQPHVLHTGLEVAHLVGAAHPFRRLRSILERHPRLTSTQRLVLLALSMYADEYGIAWPARARLHTLTGLKSRALRYAVRALEKACLVSVLLPREGRRFAYASPSRPAITVPDRACVYFVWPMVPKRFDHAARTLAMSYLRAQLLDEDEYEDEDEDE